MDILRKEIYSIYEAQHLDEETNDPGCMDEAKNRAKILADTTGGCTVITDAASDRCYIFSKGLGRIIGLTDSDYLYREVDSGDEDEIYEHLHPEDLVEKRMLEYEFFKAVDALPPEVKTEYRATCRIRMKDRGGDYRIIDNTTQIVGLSASGTMWLILCCYSLSPDQTQCDNIEPRIVDNGSGEITEFCFKDEKKHLLTDREKEILSLIKTGKASKQIADMLGISVHTVSRHRQNIIEKLSVGSCVEAIAAASAMKLL